MRRLAHIEYIHEIVPIERADKIEIAKVLGWQCVVPKGEFKVGDLGVYFEIDSFLPLDERFEFLKSKCYKNSDLLGEGYKIKTQKLRGVLSQGLLLPTDTFPEIEEFEIGKDVTNILNVKKWDIEERASSSGTIIGELPGFIPKTHEERIQNIPEILENFKDYYITTKLDGTSCTIAINEQDEFFVCGHNYVYADDGKSSFYEYVKKNNLEEKLRALKKKQNCESIVVQGEFCGAGIQKNPLKLKTPEWFPFTLIIDDKRVEYGRQQDLIIDYLGLSNVPLEEISEDLNKRYKTVEDILARAVGKYDSGEEKEGIVVRSMDGTLSFKAISNEYLLKKK